MPIHPTDGRNLKHKLQSWVLSGHSQSDAAKIANILGSANTAAEVQMKLLDKETCLPPRGFDMVSYLLFPEITASRMEKRPWY